MPVYLANNSIQEYKALQESYFGSRFGTSKGYVVYDTNLMDIKFWLLTKLIKINQILIFLIDKHENSFFLLPKGSHKNNQIWIKYLSKKCNYL